MRQAIRENLILDPKYGISEMARFIWTFDEVSKAAKKYKTRGEFRLNEPNAYAAATKKGFLDKVCKHMVRLRVPKGYYTLKKLKEIAAPFKTRLDFQLGDYGAYQSALRQGLLDEVCSHMEKIGFPSGYWNSYQNCKEEAEKYHTRSGFQKGNGSAYQGAMRNKWLDKICSHMEKGADGLHYMIYLIKNERLRQAYIGITKQHFTSRKAHHVSENNSANSSAISRLIDTEYIPLTRHVLTSDTLKIAERNWARKYAAKGYEVLNNERMFGRMGVSRRKYNDEDIQKEARKYRTRSAFKTGSPRYYDAAVSQRILNKVCAHMRGIKPKNYWSMDKVIEVAKTCSDRNDFVERFDIAYGTARANGWLDEIWEKAGLRSFNDMTWERSGVRKEIWSKADYYYQIWIENEKCGSWRMRTITGVMLEKLLKKFKTGWIPSEDKDWVKWSNLIQGEKGGGDE